MGMEGKVSGSITDLVLRIFRVVAAEEGPRALATVAVNVLHPWRTRLLGQHRHTRFQCFPAERRREAVEVRDDLPMILHQHRCDWVDLGAEVEQGVRAEWLAPFRRVHLMAID